MDRVVFVEVLDRRGRVRDRVRLDRFPARVGRAYSNDVIVEDRYVSPEHLTIRVDEAGELVLEDRGSLNGFRIVGQHGAVERARFRSGMRIQIGETVCRIVEHDHVVAAAEPIRHDASKLFGLLKRPAVSAGIGVAAFVVLFIDVYLESYFTTDLFEVAGPALLGVSAVALWASVWAFVNRLSTHRFEFPRHFAISCLAAIVSVVLIPVGEYVNFLSSSEILGAAFDDLSTLLVFTALLAGHLAILPASTPSRRWVWAGTASLIVVGLTVFLERSAREEFTTEIQFTLPLKAYGSSLASAESLDEFLASSGSVKRWVDDRAAADER